MVEGLKSTVKKRIQDQEERLWKVSSMLYRSLSFYIRTVKYKEMSIWWKFVSKSSGSFKAASCVVSLLCGTQPNGYGVNFGPNQRCNLCESFVTETTQHVVFECEGLEVIRGPNRTRLRNAMPYAMRISYDDMINTQKLDFLLSGLGCDKYEHQWRDIYDAISRMIHELYRHRAFLYKRFDNA